MNSLTARGTSLIVRLIIICGAVGFLCLSARAYHGEYLFTRAELGPKTISDYRAMIHAAWQADPWQDSASLRYAQVLQSQGKWSKSRDILEHSAAGKYHWQGWELEGAALEKLAFSETGSIDDAHAAAELYDRVLKVHPSYTRGLERRALLGLKLGEWDKVSEIADRLVAVDSNNRNAGYLRARIADGLGNDAHARELYAAISAEGPPPPGALFTTNEIAGRLTQSDQENR